MTKTRISQSTTDVNFYSQGQVFKVLVGTKEELTWHETWRAVKQGQSWDTYNTDVWVYVNMIVTVYNDYNPANNGPYKLLDLDYTNPVNWVPYSADAEIASVSTALSTEAASRIAGDNALSTSISSEISSRIGADSALNTIISNEIGSRIGADSSLTTILSSEIGSRIGADSSLTTAVSNEIGSRIGADSSLNTAVSNEIGNRIWYDGQISTNTSTIVSTEISQRISGDLVLSSAISSISGGLGGVTMAQRHILRNTYYAFDSHWMEYCDGYVQIMAGMMHVNLYIAFRAITIGQTWAYQTWGGANWYRVAGHPMFDSTGGEFQFLCNSDSAGATNLVKVVKTSPSAPDWTGAGLWIKNPSTTAWFINMVYPVGGSCNPSYVIPTQTLSVTSLIIAAGDGTLCIEHDTLDVYSNTTWYCDTTDYWIHVSYGYTSGYGNMSIPFTIDANAGGARTGYLTFYKEGITNQVVTVTQYANGVSC